MEQFKILKKVAIFFLIFAAAIHIIIYSLYFVVGALVLDDLAYRELSWVQLGSDYPHLAYLISGYIRMMGILVVVVEVFVLYTTYLIFWKSSKQAFILAIIGSATPLIMELIQTFGI